MCDRKFMFGDKSTFGLSLYGLKKGLQKKEKKICTLNKGQLPTLLR